MRGEARRGEERRGEERRGEERRGEERRGEERRGEERRGEERRGEERREEESASISVPDLKLLESTPYLPFLTPSFPHRKLKLVGVLRDRRAGV